MRYIFNTFIILIIVAGFLPLSAQLSDMHLNHHTLDGFKNPWPGFEDRGVGDLLKWGVWDRVTGKKPEKKDHYDFPVVDNDGVYLRNNESEFTVTWVGHSTLLIQLDGINILTDPIWSDRCSPVQFMGPKRVVLPGIKFEDLPPIDVVIISHNHYDHLDKNTIKMLGNIPFYFVPLGVGGFLKDQGISRYIEMDWWDSVTFDQLKIVCTPAQHFSGRKGFDNNRTLWSSWVIIGQNRRIYFGGDSGFFPEYVTIGKQFGPFDLTCLPIGAYKPRWFMKPLHMSPGDAIQAYIDLKGDYFVPIHWGTFPLADEPLDDPPAELKRQIAEKELDSSKFLILKHGETRTLTFIPVGAIQDTISGNLTK
jgi:N-acyl-phosphatidylethanolamine-hydrolysing phospholipase D